MCDAQETGSNVPCHCKVQAFYVTRSVRNVIYFAYEANVAKRWAYGINWTLFVLGLNDLLILCNSYFF